VAQAFSELLGTFFLLLAAAGGGLLHAKGEITLSAAVVAPGLTVLGIILYLGAVSGAASESSGDAQGR
jgi:aquaporin Z